MVYNGYKCVFEARATSLNFDSDVLGITYCIKECWSLLFLLFNLQCSLASFTIGLNAIIRDYGYRYTVINSCCFRFERIGHLFARLIYVNVSILTRQACVLLICVLRAVPCGRWLSDPWPPFSPLSHSAPSSGCLGEPLYCIT